MHGKDVWYHRLGLYLGEHSGKQLRVGDLFDKFGAEIPLEVASRRWVRTHEIDLPSVMRFAVFSRYVHCLSLTRPAFKRNEQC